MSYVTGISGNVISAASAAYAPTNSAEVSAIASAYATGGAQVVTSLQYATSESATVATTVTADTAIGYGARDISADYYDYGYGPWTDYDSSTPLVKVRMTSDGNMRNYSSYPFYLYMVPYGATNKGSVSTTGDITGALAYGDFSGSMHDFIIAEGTGSAYSLNPSYVEVTFDVTSVPFWGSQPARWGTVPDVGDPVDIDTATRPVFCVAGGYDGYELFEVRSNTTAEVDFGSLVTVSAVSGINNLSIAGAEGGVDEATVSAIASAYAESAVSAVSGDYYSTSNPSGFITSAPFDSATCSAIASAYAESAVSSVSSNYYTTANESGFLTSLPTDITVRNLSAYGHVRATATGQALYGNFDYAGMYFRSGSTRPYNIGIDNTGTNFYIATAKNGFERIYASSIQSWNGKLDASASSSFYTTANESGFVNSAYVDSAVSGKADSSALSSYALSADVSGTVDLVSTQSANWGGSALALSAGPGVKLEKVGDTLVAGLDRTLLWSGTRNLSATGTWALSGDPYDYEQVQIWARPHNTHKSELGCTIMPNLESNSVTDVCILGVQDALTHVRFNIANLRIDSSGFYVNSSKQISLPESTANTPTILTMVYGINRTAEV